MTAKSQDTQKNEELIARIAKLRLLVLDVDGTLTDGGIFIGPGGEEFKRFDAHDGAGIVLLQKNFGVEVAFLSGRTCAPVEFRAKELGVRTCIQGHFDKVKILQQEISRRGLDSNEVAAMGDDLSDLEMMKVTGLGFAPANAMQAVKDYAHFVSSKPGGGGAVREVCDLIMENGKTMNS